MESSVSPARAAYFVDGSPYSAVTISLAGAGNPALVPLSVNGEFIGLLYSLLENKTFRDVAKT